MGSALDEELEWLIDHPEFSERPASIREFIGPDYLNIESRVRPAVLAEIEKMIGSDVNADKPTRFPRAMFTGAIGVGKTTVASIVLPYLTHWVLCLQDPQGYFNLLPGSRIAFMQMSTSGSQAKEVVFGDIKARIQYSPWFKKYPYDKGFKNQLRFPKEIWILPGDSAETTFEGYNILGGILDEADSHKVTDKKNYAEQGYDTIHARIASRFQERGFLLVVGQMKKANGFAAKKYKEITKDPEAYGVRMTIWESLGWDRFLDANGDRDSFWFDKERSEIIPSGIASVLNSDKLIEIPNVYRTDFINNPQKALRDLAGIPPATGSPFIPLTYKITAARDRFLEHHQGFEVPVDPKSNMFAPWLFAHDSVKRVLHIDIGYSPDGDALGLAMGHVNEMVEVYGELKPYIVFDFIMRITAPAGREIFLGDVRKLIYQLKDERKFKIVKVTTDGFESTDTRQQLERRRIATDIVSVDRKTAPYEDLREALYDNRIEFPQYMVNYKIGDVSETEIAYKELSELVDNGNKIDHPEDGSKDVADAMAGVVFNLVGDRSLHRRKINLGGVNPSADPSSTSDPYLRPGIATHRPMSAPIPPSGAGTAWNPRRS